MLTPIHPKSAKITTITHTNQIFTFTSERETLRLTVYAQDIFRISVTQNDDRTFDVRQGEEFLPPEQNIPVTINQTESFYELSTPQLRAKINLNSGSISFYKKNPDDKSTVGTSVATPAAADKNKLPVSNTAGTEEKLLFSENLENPHVLEKFDLYKTAGNIKIEEIQTADGLKKRVTSADKIFDKSMYHTSLLCNFSENEKLFGLGQAEEGTWNLRGTTQYLHQANKKIAIPFLVSNAGYGLLFSTQSPAIFNDTEYGSYFYTTADYYLDYFFIAPSSKSQITAKMRQLTGKALRLPDWAFGYIQSQERYESQKEILDTVQEFENRNIPLSTIVLDWLSWEDGMWGQKSFDKSRFPDPAKMIETLHSKNVRFMISIWPSMDEKCENYKEMKQNDCLLSGINICNVFDKKGRELYWKQTNQGLAKHGIDAWWCDSSEPITPEWNYKEKQLPQNMFADYVKTVSDVMPLEKSNAYGYYHSKGMFEGMQKDYPERPVVNLTRSSYMGSQKYGVIVWSGDISATWEVLQNQLVAAIQFSLSGLPYWTFDIGAFFVKKGIQWYWNGDYDDTTNNPGYRELYTRWLQFAVFLPIFRAHGTDCRREPWTFMDKDNIFYNTIVDFIKLRYKLMPYILSVEDKVCNEDQMFIRPLFTEFSDPKVDEISTQYMFGPSMMICPVTKPMYFDKSGNPINVEKTIDVYLPSDCDWTDYWTGKKYKGGQWIKADADISKIPVFTK